MTLTSAELQRIGRDTGCSLRPSCLECDLPQCRYDTPKKSSAWARTQERRQACRDLLAQGLAAQDIAERLGISPRSVYRLRGKSAA